MISHNSDKKNQLAILFWVISHTSGFFPLRMEKLAIVELK